MCRVTELFGFVLEIIPTSVSIPSITCYSQILSVCYKNKKIFYCLQDKINVYTQSVIFIIVPFCVPCVQLLQDLDSDWGRQIAVHVCNYTQES